jgi:hypothetical protein
MKNQSIGEMVRDSGADDDCPACADREDACPACARKIHESWHKAGLWWIRQEECRAWEWPLESLTLAVDRQ